MTPSPTPRFGVPIGRYTLVREIATGGMATVFLAHVTTRGVEREVAIKRLHPHLAVEEEFVAMFFDEAKLAARIHHPNVVSTLEIDDIDGLSLVMEYIKGPTLLELARDQSKRGARIPRPVVARIASDVLAGLHAAHELRDDAGELLHIVHRDVSPHNVLVGVDGVSRITDFGIAKASVRLSSTRDGQIKGKLSYMAPEQLTSDEVDRRTDVFTAGIVFWEMFTGRRLLNGSSEARIVNTLLTGEIPSARAVAPDLPEALDAVVMKALSRDPDARWSSCDEFAAAITDAVPPASYGVVAGFAERAFEAVLARPRAAPVSLTPAPLSDVRRVVPAEPAPLVQEEGDDAAEDPTATVPLPEGDPGAHPASYDPWLAPPLSRPTPPTGSAVAAPPVYPVLVEPPPVDPRDEPAAAPGQGARGVVAGVVAVLCAALVGVAVASGFFSRPPPPVPGPSPLAERATSVVEPAPPPPEAPPPTAPPPAAPPPAVAEASAPPAAPVSAPSARRATPHRAHRPRHAPRVPLARTRDGRLIIR